MVVAVTPREVAPPLFPVNLGVHGSAYGDANCGVDGVQVWPLTVIPVPALMLPDAGYAHGYGPSPAGPEVASFVPLDAAPARPLPPAVASVKVSTVPAAIIATAGRRSRPLPLDRRAPSRRDTRQFVRLLMVPPHL